MESTHPLASDGASLTGVVHGVRDRWRLKRALRGASIVLAAAFVLLAGSAYILDKLHYGHTALVVTRGIVLLIVAVLAAVFVGAPLLPRRRPSDRRVALYLEEHAPSLDAAVLTAVELQEREAKADAGDAIRTRRPVSSTLLSHLTRTALERVHSIDDGRHVDERELHVSAGILAGVIGVALLVTLLGPTTLRHGMGLMLVPWDREHVAEAYAISAEPGNVTVARGGDIAALKGTQVRVRVTTTVPARGGRLIVERGQRTDTVALTPLADGTLGGSLRVDAAGFYKVELQAQDGRIFPGSLDYTIDALPDRPPTIVFTKPGRDEKVLNVDEVYAEVQADDDYGVQKLDLVYSVNGGPEKTEPLYVASHRTPQMTAGHTFALEDFKLQPGDVV